MYSNPFEEKIAYALEIIRPIIRSFFKAKECEDGYESIKNVCIKQIIPFFCSSIPFDLIVNYFDANDLDLLIKYTHRKAIKEQIKGG